MFLNYKLEGEFTIPLDVSAQKIEIIEKLDNKFNHQFIS